MSKRIIDTKTTSSYNIGDYVVIVRDGNTLISEIQNFYTPVSLSANTGVYLVGNRMGTILTSIVSSPLTANDIYSLVGMNYDTTLSANGSGAIGVNDTNIYLTGTASSIDYVNSGGNRTNLSHSQFISRNLWDNTGNLTKKYLGYYEVPVSDTEGNIITKRLDDNQGDNIFILGARIQTIRDRLTATDLPDSTLVPGKKIMQQGVIPGYFYNVEFYTKYLPITNTIKDGTSLSIANSIKNYVDIFLPPGQYSLIDGYLCTGIGLFPVYYVSAQIEHYRYNSGEYELFDIISNNVYGSYNSSQYNIAPGYVKLVGNKKFISKNTIFNGGVFPDYFKIRVITQQEKLQPGPMITAETTIRGYTGLLTDAYVDNFCPYMFKFKYYGSL